MIRENVLRCLALTFSRSGLAGGLDRLNGRAGGLVLAYHDITSETLARQITVVAERYRIVRLGEMAERLRSGRSTAGLAAITFDDGLSDAMEAAADLAARAGWPMTFYIPTRYVDTGEPYWFSELTPLIIGAKPDRLRLGTREYRLTGRGERLRARDQVGELFRRLDSFEKVDGLIREVRLALTGSEDRPSDLPLPAPPTWPRLRELASRDELSFEAHSVHHLPMSRLDDDAVRCEMKASRARIEEMTGRRVEHFCFPFGEAPQIGTRAPDLARELFRSSVTMVRGRWTADAHAGFLPRVPLYEKDSEDVVALKVGLAR